MTTSKLRFGNSGEVSLELRDGAVLDEPAAPVGDPLPNVAEAVLASLKEPLQFPSMDRIVLADDSVAIALQPEMPCAAELLAGAIRGIMDAGVPPELIRIVRIPNDRGVSDKKLLSQLDDGVAERVTISQHDPGNREQLSFLGASKDDNAIYVNRELCDADFVLPIGVQGVSEGLHGSWFPAFSDVEMQERFHKNMSAASEKKKAKQLAECEEAGWMMGIQFVVQLVPAGNNQAMHVLSGLPQAVWDRGNELLKEAWEVKVDQPANLVVAGIGGGPEQQTWDNVTRTIDQLLDAVEVDGAIAICSQLKAKPGPALRRLAQSDDYESADIAIKRKATADAMSAARLNRALQRVRVYLLSELNERDVEDLGVAYVSDPKEIAKLSSQFDSCLALENAQHVSIAKKEAVE